MPPTVATATLEHRRQRRTGLRGRSSGLAAQSASSATLGAERGGPARPPAPTAGTAPLSWPAPSRRTARSGTPSSRSADDAVDTGHVGLAAPTYRRATVVVPEAGRLDMECPLAELLAQADSIRCRSGPRVTLPAAAALARAAGLSRTGVVDHGSGPRRRRCPSPRSARRHDPQPSGPGTDESLARASTRAAFAHHPEQGRISPPTSTSGWPSHGSTQHGFLLAERGRQVIGFHWTKQHGRPARRGVRDRRRSRRGRRGLGKALLLRRAALAARGRRYRVELYVESDHGRRSAYIAARASPSAAGTCCTRPAELGSTAASPGTDAPIPPARRGSRARASFTWSY